MAVLFMILAPTKNYISGVHQYEIGWSMHLYSGQYLKNKQTNSVAKLGDFTCRDISQKVKIIHLS